MASTAKSQDEDDAARSQAGSLVVDSPPGLAHAQEGTDTLQPADSQVSNQAVPSIKGKGKRHASTSADQPEPDEEDGPSTLSSHKRRFALRSHAPLQTRQTPQGNAASKSASALDILAEAAESAPRLQVPSTAPPNVKREGAHRCILLDTPFPSPHAPKFDILTALISHCDILLLIARYLPPQTLLNLYSVSAPFHYLMDSHFTNFILASAKTWAPDADFNYPWWCYKHLCIEDPALRRLRWGDRGAKAMSWTDHHGHSVTSAEEAFAIGASPPASSLPRQQAPALALGQRDLQPTPETPIKPTPGYTIKLAPEGTVKPAPSFRWLKMVCYREKVAMEIIGWFCAHGHRIPRHPGLIALKRLWFLMDVPLNASRIALMHNTVFFPPPIITLLHVLLFKLDMMYQDPLHYWGGEYRLRESLMAERSLTVLWNWLRGADGRRRIDVARLFVRHGYARREPVQPMNRAVFERYMVKKEMPIMGVPGYLIGRWEWEARGKGRQRLMRPDELLIREGVRRKMDLQRYYIRMMASGYYDGHLGRLPRAKPHDVVLSRIRRRKNMEKAQEERKSSMKDVKKESAT